MYKIMSRIKNGNKKTLLSIKGNTIVIKSIIMSKDFEKSCNWIIKIEFGSGFINPNYEIKFLKTEELWTRG